MSTYGHEDTSFRAAGERPGVEKLVHLFYDHMDSLPEARVVRAMHAESLDTSREKLIVFLSGWLGGPKLYAQTFGPIRIPPAHAHLTIDEAERDAWLLCMQRAVDEQPWDDEFKDYFMVQIRVPAERVRMVSAARRAAEQ